MTATPPPPPAPRARRPLLPFAAAVLALLASSSAAAASPTSASAAARGAGAGASASSSSSARIDGARSLRQDQGPGGGGRKVGGGGGGGGEDDAEDDPPPPPSALAADVRYFCTEDRPPLDVETYCDDDDDNDENFYAKWKECESDCKGKRRCASVDCPLPTEPPTTEPPTSAPSAAPSATPSSLPSALPSSTPSSRPSEEEAEATTAATSTATTTAASAATTAEIAGSGTASTATPPEPELTFVAPEEDGDAEEETGADTEVEVVASSSNEELIPLSPFALDLAVAAPRRGGGGRSLRAGSATAVSGGRTEVRKLGMPETSIVDVWCVRQRRRRGTSAPRPRRFSRPRAGLSVSGAGGRRMSTAPTPRRFDGRRLGAACAEEGMYLPEGPEVRRPRKKTRPTGRRPARSLRARSRRLSRSGMRLERTARAGAFSADCTTSARERRRTVSQLGTETDRVGCLPPRGRRAAGAFPRIPPAPGRANSLLGARASLSRGHEARLHPLRSRARFFLRVRSLETPARLLRGRGFGSVPSLEPALSDLLDRSSTLVPHHTQHRRARTLRKDDLLFGPAQDAAVLAVASDHLLQQFDDVLPGAPAGVRLDIVERSERRIGSGSAQSSSETTDGGDAVDAIETYLVSYALEGRAAWTLGDGPALPPPTTEELDAAVSRAFNESPGKGEFLAAATKTEDEVLRGIVNVRVVAANDEDGGGGGGGGSDPDPSSAGEGAGLSAVGYRDAGASSDDRALAIPFVILIGSAFAVTLFVGGLLVFRKYQRYQRDSANNSYVSYQNGKRKVTLDKKGKRRYDHFESPEGSLDQLDGAGKGGTGGMRTSYGDDGGAYDDLEIRGGSTFPASLSCSDADPASPRQFDPDAPYDEEGLRVADGDEPTTTTTARSFPSSHTPSKLAAEMDRSRLSTVPSRDETLEGLYSDKDSYFQSTVGGGGGGGGGVPHRRGDSLVSLDTLGDAFFDGGNEVQVDLVVDGIGEVVGNDDRRGADAWFDAGTGAAATSRPSEEEAARAAPAPVFRDDSADYDDVPVFEEGLSREDSRGSSASRGGGGGGRRGVPRGDDDVLRWRRDEALPTPRAGGGGSSASNGGAADLAQFLSPAGSNLSDASATDELYARIAELEDKILSTEGRLEGLDGDGTTNGARVEIPAVVAPVRTTEVPLDAGLSAMRRGRPLADETLAAIERSRLSGTPPPSEGEVDGEAVREARENSLLGEGSRPDDDEAGSDEDGRFL